MQDLTTSLDHFALRMIVPSALRYGMQQITVAKGTPPLGVQ
jgi:hypothetical protein